MKKCDLPRNPSRYPKFSVLLPTYKHDSPSELDQAIKSLASQTIQPDELCIVKDGQLTNELNLVIENHKHKFPGAIETCRIEENQGLGNALRTGVESCSYEIIARMDADDVSVPKRFEHQLSFMNNNPQVDIVGGNIQEFDSDLKDVIGKRKVPTDHKKIKRMAKFRSPVNHVTVMFKKQSVLEAGNYRAVNDLEDYDLWVRMLINGATFANIPRVLVNVRAGEAMYGRRGGWEYAREELRTQIEFYNRGFISLPIFLFNTITRFFLRLMPSQIRGKIYRLLARN